MKAIVYHKYGSPDVLELREIDRPAVDADGVLVRVRAASVNALDWHLIRGLPYAGRVILGLRKPKRNIPGVDLAGRVEAVGREVTQFRPGDEVMGHCRGAFAEYVCGRERNFVPKPARITFEQAAAVPVAGLTALQGLRDVGRIGSGQQVLINGAAGGVGTFAVQIAKSFGAEVAGVCSARNVDMVRSLGADRVIDYAKDDFTRTARRYDLIFDVAGSRSLSDCRRVLAHDGTLVLVGAPEGRWLAPFPRLLRAFVLSRFVSQRLVMFLAKVDRSDLVALRELIEAGKVTPVVDRCYPLREAAEAIRYVEAKHARAKVIVTLEWDGRTAAETPG